VYWRTHAMADLIAPLFSTTNTSSGGTAKPCNAPDSQHGNYSGESMPGKPLLFSPDRSRGTVSVPATNGRVWLKG
jgi:hypothetical protein